MFQHEMEDLELGFNLGSSDLLFPDDLFNIPLDQQLAEDNNNGQQQSENYIDYMAVNEPTEQATDFFGEQDEILKKDSATSSGEGASCTFATEGVDLEKVINDMGIKAMDQKQFVEDPMTEVVLDDATLNQLIFEEVEQPPTSSANAIKEEEHQQQLEEMLMSPAASNTGSEDTQSLIEEMEEFLVKRENSNSLDDSTNDIGDPQANSTLDNAQAEQLLDALMKGNISMDEDDTNDSGLGVSNVSEIITEDGQKIVIVIAQDDQVKKLQEQIVPASPSNYSATSSPGPSSYNTDQSDSDWSPNSPAIIKRKANKKNNSGSVTKRGPYKRNNNSNVKDKKERKKLQNVVAARRYRDKKKVEQMSVETEEQQLQNYNKGLKGKLGEIESEMKTLKKLMVELGLVKIKNN